MRLTGLGFLVIAAIASASLILASPERSKQSDDVTFEVTQDAKDAMVTTNGSARLSRSEAERLYYSLAAGLGTGSVSAADQREADARTVESLTSEVSDPVWRSAISRAATAIRNKQESPRQQR